MWVRYRLSNEKLLRRMGPFLALNRPGAMSALQPLSGGKRTHCGHVATAVFDPFRTLVAVSLDHLVRAAKQQRRDVEAERLGGLHVNDQLDFRGLLDGQARCARESMPKA